MRGIIGREDDINHRSHSQLLGAGDTVLQVQTLDDVLMAYPASLNL
jgi:hypothetical protein